MKSRDIFKQNNVLKTTLVGILITVVIVPLIIDNSFQEYFTWLSTACSVATLIVALMLFDELDKKKLRFNKVLDAVESHVGNLCNTKFHITAVQKGIFLSKKGNYFSITPKFYRYFFYLNWPSINGSDKSLSQLPIFYSEGGLDAILENKPSIHNPWIPKEIKEPLQGIFLYDLAPMVTEEDLPQKFMIISAYNEDIYKAKLFTIKYRNVYVENYGEFNVRMAKILKSIENFYFTHFSESPDFNGD